MLYVSVKNLGDCCFSLGSESPESPDFSRSNRIFWRIREWLGHSRLSSIKFLFASHKHPTSVILSCFSLCAKFGPKRTIDIQNQYAHIKGEYYKRSLIFLDYLL
jgi:hypothetical protein